MWNLEGHMFTKIWPNEEKQFEKLMSKNIHEVEELKRAHEMRIDEFCSEIPMKWKNKNITNDLTFEIQTMQERTDCVDGYG